MQVNVTSFNLASLIWRHRHRPVGAPNLLSVGWHDACWNNRPAWVRRVPRETRRLFRRCRWGLAGHHPNKVVTNMQVESISYTATGISWAGKVLDAHMECSRCGKHLPPATRPPATEFGGMSFRFIKD